MYLMHATRSQWNSCQPSVSAAILAIQTSHHSCSNPSLTLMRSSEHILEHEQYQLRLTTCFAVDSLTKSNLKSLSSIPRQEHSPSRQEPFRLRNHILLCNRFILSSGNTCKRITFGFAFQVITLIETWMRVGDTSHMSLSRIKHHASRTSLIGMDRYHSGMLEYLYLTFDRNVPK